MSRETATGASAKPRAARWAILGVLLVGAGAALDRGAWCLWQQRTVTIDTSVDPFVTVDAKDEWEQLLEGGDAPAGERLFFDPARASRCGACHLFQGRGERKGPNLTESARLPLQRLLRDIVDPGFSLARGFESATLTTKDGRVISGWRDAREHPTILWIRRDDGTVFETARTEIEELRYSSAMPTNFAQQLTLQDCRDLLAFLRSGIELGPKGEVKGGAAAPTNTAAQ